MLVPKTILRKSPNHESNLRYWIRIARDSKLTEQGFIKAPEITAHESKNVNRSITEPLAHVDVAQMREAVLSLANGLHEASHSGNLISLIKKCDII